MKKKKTILKSKESCTMITANGTFTSTEEAIVYVKDVDMLIVGKLCEEHGYSNEWKEETIIT